MSPMSRSILVRRPFLFGIQYLHQPSLSLSQLFSTADVPDKATAVRALPVFISTEDFADIRAVSFPHTSKGDRRLCQV
jgi:hypothetical protein